MLTATNHRGLVMLRALFAQDAPAVAALFDAVVELLTGVGRRHKRLMLAA